MNYESMLNYVMYLNHFMNYESIFNYFMYSNSNSNSSELSYDSQVTSFFSSPIRLQVTSLSTLVRTILVGINSFTFPCCTSCKEGQ